MKTLFRPHLKKSGLNTVIHANTKHALFSRQITDNIADDILLLLFWVVQFINTLIDRYLPAWRHKITLNGTVNYRKEVICDRYHVRLSHDKYILNRLVSFVK